MIDRIHSRVAAILDKDNTGHGMEHVDRVLRLSLKFAEAEAADKEAVALIALLHDVDDYKLFGFENAAQMPNARAIMEAENISEEKQKLVLEALGAIGYSKSLDGIRPTSLEGMIVSDADMCDAVGANGIIRTYTYSLSHGKPFFDKEKFPLFDMSREEYTTHNSDSSVDHFFEKILKLKNMMMTPSGKREALARHKLMISFLRQLFDEEDAPEWQEYLDKYLKAIN